MLYFTHKLLEETKSRDLARHLMISHDWLDGKTSAKGTPVKSLYKKYFPEDKTQTNLQNWEKFEEQQPTTFAGMYQFWVSKISI